jgi:hypothetical protein
LVKKRILLPGRGCWGWLDVQYSYLGEGVEAGYKEDTSTWEKVLRLATRRDPPTGRRC